MSGCDFWDYIEVEGDVGECPECGEETIDGRAIYGCSHNFVVCDTCGSTPCQGSC